MEAERNKGGNQKGSNRPFETPPRAPRYQGPAEPDVSLPPGGERNMLSAMVLRHVKDLRKKSRRRDSRLEQEEARQWIFGPRTTFPEVISWLGWDPDVIRQRLWTDEEAKKGERTS